MVKITEFYAELNRDIKDASNKKQLQLYRKRGRIYMKNLETDQEQKTAKKYYANSLKLIKWKQGQI